MELFRRYTALLFIALVLLVQNETAADGYWALDAIPREHGGRDDVSTIWINVSETAVVGKSTWKWPTMDSAAIDESRFSWSGIPKVMEPGEEYNLTVYLEQLANNYGGSGIVIYPGRLHNINDLSYLNMSGVGYGPRVDFGAGDGLVGNNTLAIVGPYHQPSDPPYYAILINCYLYQDWYAVQYRFKWVDGAVPPAYTKPDARVEPAPKNSNAPVISTKPFTSQIETGAAPASLPDYVASPLGAEYKIKDYATCKDVIEKEPVGRADEFSTEDARAYQWIKIVPQYRSHMVENKWYSPDGRLYYHSQSKSDDVRNDESWKFWSWIAIKGRDAENLPGLWKVDTYIDGHYVLSQPFVIRPASQQATILVDSRDQGFMSDIPQSKPI